MLNKKPTKLPFETAPKQFRVWDTLHHRWFQGGTSEERIEHMTDSVDYFGEVLVMEGTSFDQNEDNAWKGQVRSSLEMLDYLIVVQNTGMRDKENRFIYEGDILEFGEGVLRYVSYDYTIGEYVQMEKGKGESNTVYGWCFGKIVGNIFEDKEKLL